MFVELMPLRKQRTLLITVTRIDDKPRSNLLRLLTCVEQVHISLSRSAARWRRRTSPGANDLLTCTGAGYERLKMISAAIPLGRRGTADHVARAVVFLASDDSSYVAGAELFVDGGFAQV